MQCDWREVSVYIKSSCFFIFINFKFIKHVSCNENTTPIIIPHNSFTGYI